MAERRFSHFVIFAEMRTGSNFLETNINQFADLQSYGELFNPHFIGGPNKGDLFGLKLSEREKDPFQAINAIRAVDDSVTAGFRFFFDHDPRILDDCLNDKNCGKVILTRNPLDSYVSRKIAAETGQWKLTNVKHKKTAKIVFDAAEFEQHIEDTQKFQLKLLNALQSSGQTAFYIGYDDIHSVDVLNGLAGFLGSVHRAQSIDQGLKRQNPASLESKVVNFDEMKQALGRIDFLNLSRTPNFEPRRGAGVPQYLAGSKTPLLFVPIKGGPVATVKSWMAAHEGIETDDLIKGFNQKSLKEWRQDHPGFQSFTVLRHPVARAHYSFCEYILNPHKGAYRDLRESLIRDFKVRIPKKGAKADGYDLTMHKAAFITFLKFLKANLADQTSLRVDPAWASQAAILQGVTSVGVVGHIVHETALAPSLEFIEALAGLPNKPVEPVGSSDCPFQLEDIYDADIEKRARDIYTRDYLNFGFSDWARLP